MPRWKPPKKITMPSEFEDAAADDVWPATFEYNGVLPNGTQTLAYIYSTPPDAAGTRRELMAIHEFDANCKHRSIRTRFATTGANTELHAMFAPYRAAGWQPREIRVLPFLVEANGFHHGFEFPELEPGDEYEDDTGEADVFFLPFGFPFHPPFTDGSYST